MSDEQSSQLSAGSGTIAGDRVDMDALRELSVQQYDKEFGSPEETPAKAPTIKKAAPVIEAPAEYETEEETYEEDGEPTERDKIHADGEGESDEEVAEEGETEETAKEDDEDADYIIARAKNGRAVKVSKEATVDIKIDGKVESLPMQEVINRASGAIALDRGHTDLGRERAEHRRQIVAFQAEKQKFEEETAVTNDNYAALQEIAASGNPEDFAQYYGALMGKDPSQVLEGIIQNAIKYAEQFSQMTDREKAWYNENRKYKFAQNLSKITQQREAKKQAFNQERAFVETALKEEGLEMKDFLSAANDVREQILAGKLQGQYTAKDIVEYASWMKRDASVKESISSVDKTLLSDVSFVDRVSKAIVRVEAAEGTKMSPAEIKTFIKRAAESQKKGISESLSKKVERHNKSGKTNSKIASSQNRENKSGEAVTLAEHKERLYGGY